MFKELLKKRDISQREVAIVLRISQQSVSKWVLGLSEPSLNSVIKMSNNFNIPIEDIVLAFKKGEEVNGCRN